MNAESTVLLNQAQDKARELSQHPVLSQYWEKLSLVLGGSTARGNADRYSDIDLVFYAPDLVRTSVISGYREQGLTRRTDGVFVHFPNGHYHIDSYEVLHGYFLRKDFVHCWDVENTIVLSDPTGAFSQILEDGRRQLFQCPLDIVKGAYLDLQIDLDWMRMPIARGDAIATFLHAAKIMQGLCRAAFLLDGRSYPPDKWIAHYLPSTSWGCAHGERLSRYLANCHQVNELVPHQPYAENPLYSELASLIDEVGRSIQHAHGDQPWLHEWYNYV